ncbi:oxo-acid lyase [Cohnella algarum]|nr:KDGP aldolase [Cohnella massiliensis]MBN2981866.1 oxo-acid lyase [Cohnella algarum]
MTSIQKLGKIGDRLLFNFLALDKRNAEEVMEASGGYAVPGIVSTDFATPEEASARVAQLKEAAPIVSVGLGGGGDTSMWRKVLDIGLASDPGHINQPFHTASYAQGMFDKAGVAQYVNALIAPTGQKGVVRLANGSEIDVDALLELAAMMNVVSIKVMPVKGLDHLDELVYIAQAAARRGIYGIEPAGGIHAGNVRELVAALLRTDIPFVMPHIFGNTIDPGSGRTLPEKVEEIVKPFR